MIKAVLFDLDGTLLYRDASVEQFIAIQYDRLSNELNHISKNDYTARFVELDCVFVGDNPEADIIGAKNAGIKAIWKRNLSWQEVKEADAIVDELHEILPILKSRLPTVGYANDRLKKH
jgi:FMN phosphatase YigB (HAD superfamily)